MAGELSKLFAQPRMPVPNPIRQMERGAFYDPWGFPVDVTRPTLQNPDGTISTERTVTEQFAVPDDRPWLNLPTIVGGQQLGLAEALAATSAGANEPVGRFKSLQDAKQAAVDRTNYLGLLEAFGALGQGGR